MRITMQSSKRRLVSLTIAALSAFAGSAFAQAPWPAKPVRMVVAFPPGGPTDVVARIIAARLADQIGQQVVIENRSGAGGNIGAEVVAKAAPDGYTVFYNTSAITIAPSLYAKLSYDVERDFAPVALVATVPLMLVINSNLPPKTLAEFITWAKAQGGKINYASSGTGVITHLAGALFTRELGIQAQHIPYKGSAPAIADVAAGQAQFMIDALVAPMPFVRDGRLRALAVGTMKRSSVLPDVPTLHETVLPNFEMSAWQGVLAPAGTPATVIDRLNGELLKAIANPDVRAKLATQGAEPLGNTPAQYAAYLRSETARWTKVVRDAGARAE